MQPSVGVAYWLIKDHANCCTSPALLSPRSLYPGREEGQEIGLKVDEDMQMAKHLHNTRVELLKEVLAERKET